MEICERAKIVMCRKVGNQPLKLGGACIHWDGAVYGDDVPGPDFVAVVALSGIASACSEVIEVACRARGFVVVVARCGARSSSVPAPRWSIAVGVVLRGAVEIGVVSGGKNGAWQQVKKRTG